MRYLIIPVFAMFTVACSELPTSPSPVIEEPPPVVTTPPPTEPAPAPGAAPYRWDRVAAGCMANTTPSPLPDLEDAVLTPQEPGVMRATWYSYTASNGRTGLLFANFVLQENEYRLCNWDMSDVV